MKVHQAGATAADLCRKHGISDTTFYKWWPRYGGMEVSDAKRLKGPEGTVAEGRVSHPNNAKLKKLLAESLLDG